MYKLFLLCLIFSSSLFAQPVYTAYLDADSNEDPKERDGTYDHPFKYTSELPESFGDYTEVNLKFFGAEESYQYEASTSETIILTPQNALVLNIAAVITNEHPGSAKFEGLNQYVHAMYFDNSTQNININGIEFRNTLDYCIRFQGENGDSITDVYVCNCYFEETIGHDESNCAAIRIQYGKNIVVDSCTIIQKNRPYQVDGIYADYSNNVTIKNNNY